MLIELAHGPRQVGRADADTVDALHLQNGIEVLDGLDVLDLQNYQRLAIGVVDVLRPRHHAVAIAATDAAAAIAPRRILARRHRCPRRLGRVDHRDDHAGGRQVQDRLDDAVFVPRHAHQRRAVRAANRHDVLLDAVDRVRRVLGVNPREIIADVASYLAHRRIRQRDHHAKTHAASMDLAKKLLNVVDAHEHKSPCYTPIHANTHDDTRQ